jgi:hypothetical protein
LNSTSKPWKSFNDGGTGSHATGFRTALTTGCFASPRPAKLELGGSRTRRGRTASQSDVVLLLLFQTSSATPSK